MAKRHLKTFKKNEDMSGLDKSWLDSLLLMRDRIRHDGGFTAEENGGFRRVAISSVGVAPASGYNVYVLDESHDYRDRFWWFAGTFDADSSRILYPGHQEDNRYNLASALVPTGKVYFTRNGYADPPGTDTDNYFKLTSLGNVRMWARSSDGALMMGITGLTSGDSVSVMGMLYVSPVLNEYRSGVTGTADASFFDAVDGEPIEPHDLNNLQDGQHMEQLLGEGSFPLGPVLFGDPAIPYEWTVRGETKRQRLLDPHVRRYLSFGAVTGDRVLLDRTYDWRDRVIYARVCSSDTVDRRPGEAGDTLGGSNSAADVEDFTVVGYTGEGGYSVGFATLEGNFEADADTGYLYWDMDGAANDLDTVNMLVFASPRLGPRSAGLPSPRLIADPNRGKVRNVLVDSANSDLVSIVARYRMDRGLILDGGKVALIGDQTGNGYHMRQLDPALRASAPQTRSALNSVDCIGLDGSAYYETVKALPASSAGYYVAVVCEPLTTASDFEMWRGMLPLSTEGQISGPIFGTMVDSIWSPNQTDLPVYKHRNAATTYAAGVGLGVAWDFSVDSDPARLEPNISIRQVGGVASLTSFVSASPAGVGAADVQSLLWRLFEGFHGYVAEVIICEAGQSAVADFLNSADIVSRYGF